MVSTRQAKSAREKAAEMRAEAARQEARRRTIGIVAAVLAVVVVAVGAGVIIRTAKHDQDVKTQEATAPPKNLTNGGLLVGKPSAKVTVALWEDFQCPVCRDFEAADGAQLATWVADGTVKLEYHPVAILDRMSSTQYSTRALNAAAAVIDADPGAFVRFHGLLYANQPPENGTGLPDGRLIDYAVQAGVQRAAVETAITTLRYRGWTEKVTNDFSVQGYTGTPTVVVNGTVLTDWSPAKLTAAVTAAAKG